MQFEYVASAPGRLALFNKDIERSTDFQEALKKYFRIVYKTRKSKEYEYAMLYNAYTEQEIPEKLNKLDWLGAKTKYADSGGLQAITLGVDIDDNFKKTIYKNQCLNADIGMCFDEIPLHIDSDNGSKIGSNQDRFLLNELLVPKGLQTGSHINNQINEFRNYLESKAKVMVIGQGQDYETYLTFLSSVIKNINEENYDYIQGVSLSGACRGNNLFSNIDIFNTIRHLDIPYQFKQHIHFLGAGAFVKIIPAIILDNSGFIGDFRLSYDSTSHMSSFDYSQYQYYDYDAKKVYYVSVLGKTRNKDIDKVYYNKIYIPYKELWDDIGVVDYEDMMNYTIYTNIKELKNAKPKEFRSYSTKSMIVYHLTKFIYVHSQIMDFNKVLLDFKNGVLQLSDIFPNNKKFVQALKFLQSVDDDQSYQEWVKITKRYFLNSKSNIITKYDSYYDYYLDKKAIHDLF